MQSTEKSRQWLVGGGQAPAWSGRATRAPREPVTAVPAMVEHASWYDQYQK